MTRDWEVKRRGSIFLLLDTARNKVQDTALLPCTLKWKCLFLSTVALASLWGGWVKPHCTSHEGARRGHKTNEGSIKKDNFLFNCKSCFSYQLETKVAGGKTCNHYCSYTSAEGGDISKLGSKEDKFLICATSAFCAFSRTSTSFP